MNVIDSAGVFHTVLLGLLMGLDMDLELKLEYLLKLFTKRTCRLEGLVTYKYFLKGDGNIVDDFSSGKAIYTHKDL